jgi:hypothetical protein
MSESDPSTTGEFHFEIAPYRPSNLFGTRLSFQRSTAFNFDPDTLLRACTGQGLIRHIESGSTYKYYRALLAYARSRETGSTLQKGSRDELVSAMKSFQYLGRDGMPDDLVEMPNGLASPWRILYRSARSANGDLFIRRLFARFAAYDRGAHQITLSSDEPAKLLMRSRWMGGAATFWDATGLRVNAWAAIALDCTLQHLVWVDSQELNSYGRQNSLDIPLMARPSKAPMRHWFDDLLRQTRHGDLKALAAYLEYQHARGIGPKISAQALRHWASTQFLISIESATELLKALNSKVSFERELHRLMLARLLTFFSEVIRCFSLNPVSEQDAREVIYTRLLQLASHTRATDS